MAVARFWLTAADDGRAGSPLIGRRLDDLRLRDRYGANVVGIERWRKFRRVMVSAGGNTERRPRDVLLIDMSAAEMDLRQFSAAAASVCARSLRLARKCSD